MLSDADRQALSAAFERVKALFQAPVKDWPAFVKLTYDDDAIVMPPGAPAARGHEEILALFRTFPPFSGFDQVSQEMDGFGDLAYSRDAYSWVPELPGIPPTAQTGKALTLWKKQTDGSWKMLREMWNPDHP